MKTGCVSTGHVKTGTYKQRSCVDRGIVQGHVKTGTY